MDEPPSELPRLYDSLPDCQCPTTTSALLRTAGFMSEDSDRRILHRFDKLRIFVLLRLQHRLAAMATKLESMCHECDDRVGRGEIDDKKDDALNCLAVDIGHVIKEYDEVFWAQARFDSLRSPSDDFIHKFIDHCATKHKVLSRDLGATHFRKVRVDELASTASRDKSPIHQFIDKHNFLNRLFVGPTYKSQRERASVYIYSESAIRRVERTFVHVSFCFLLLCPIVALSIIGSVVGKLCVVIAFLLLAAFLTSGVLTGANNNGLAVLVGYGAILIFFLGVRVDLSSSG